MLQELLEILALAVPFGQGISDANATLKTLPDASLAKSVEPWLSVTEHPAEHFAG